MHVPGLKSGPQKGLPDLHDCVICLDSHGALVFIVGDNDRHGLSPLGYDDLFLIVQGSLDQPAELFPPLGYAKSNFLHLISEIVLGSVLDRLYRLGGKKDGRGSL